MALLGGQSPEADPESSTLQTAIWAAVTDSGWVKVTELLRPIRGSTQAKYAAVRVLVVQGLLVRKHGWVRRSEAGKEPGAEDFRSQKFPMQPLFIEPRGQGKGGS